MKKLCLFFVSCFLLQSFAWASPQESLKSILDEYRYATTVEWDQQDQAEFKMIQSRFAEQLKAVINEEKLTGKDVQKFLKDNAHDLKIDEILLSQIVDRNGDLNLELTDRLIREHADHMYSQGASYTPQQVLIGGLIGLLVLEIIVLAVTSKDDVCPNPEYHPIDVPYACNY